MDAALRRIVNPEETERSAEEAQKQLLERYGGKEAFLRTFKPSLFSPIPKI